MKNKKGQALIEFILVLPIFLMLILAVFDYVKIMQTKYKLESIMEDVILDNNTNLDNNIILNIEINSNIITYKLNENIDITSPILSVILKNPYNVEITRSIYEK